MSMNIYRRIYTENYGPIPKDPSGRTFDIHHWDGDRTNNKPENLIALPIGIHYVIHYIQGDAAAARMILLKMKRKTEEISFLSRQTQIKRIQNGTHHFLDPNYHKQQAKRLLEKGTHNFCGENHPAKKLYREGKHHWQITGNPGIQQNKIRMNNGTHQVLQKIKCPHCGKITNVPNAKRWHFDRCSQLLKNSVSFRNE